MSKKTIELLTKTINALTKLPNRFSSADALKLLKEQSVSNFYLQMLMMSGALSRPERGTYIKTDAFYKTPVRELYNIILEGQKSDRVKKKEETTKPVIVSAKNIQPGQITEKAAIKFLKGLGYKIMKLEYQEI